jgi:hypothetical protein
MDINPEIIPPCGLYCGMCRMYQATQANDYSVLGRLAKIYSRRVPELAPLQAEDLCCDGCRSERKSIFCRNCSIRDCALEKGYLGCHECTDFPCELISEFPIPEGRKVIMRAIPFWSAHGTQAWIAAEEVRYRCPACDHRLYRGARGCPECSAPVDLS